MFLTLRGLPPDIKISEIRSCIYERSKVNRFMLDEVMTEEGGTQRVKVAPTSFADAVKIRRALSGEPLGAYTLLVETYQPRIAPVVCSEVTNSGQDQAKKNEPRIYIMEIDLGNNEACNTSSGLRDTIGPGGSDKKSKTDNEKCDSTTTHDSIVQCSKSRGSNLNPSERKEGNDPSQNSVSDGSSLSIHEKSNDRETSGLGRHEQNYRKYGTALSSIRENSEEDAGDLGDLENNIKTDRTSFDGFKGKSEIEGNSVVDSAGEMEANDGGPDGFKETIDELAEKDKLGLGKRIRDESFHGSFRKRKCEGDDNLELSPHTNNIKRNCRKEPSCESRCQLEVDCQSADKDCLVGFTKAKGNSEDHGHSRLWEPSVQTGQKQQQNCTPDLRENRIEKDSKLSSGKELEERMGVDIESLRKHSQSPERNDLSKSEGVLPDQNHTQSQTKILQCPLKQPVSPVNSAQAKIFVKNLQNLISSNVLEPNSITQGVPQIRPHKKKRKIKKKPAHQQMQPQSKAPIHSICMQPQSGPPIQPMGTGSQLGQPVQPVSMQPRFCPPNHAMETQSPFGPPIQSMGLRSRFNPPTQLMDMQPRFGPSIQRMSARTQFHPPQSIEMQSRFGPPILPIGVQSLLNPPAHAMEMQSHFARPFESMDMGPQLDPPAQSIYMQSRFGPPNQPIDVQSHLNPPTQTMEMQFRIGRPLESMDMGPQLDPPAQSIDMQSRFGPPNQPIGIQSHFNPPTQAMEMQFRFGRPHESMEMGSQLNPPTQSIEMQSRFGPPNQPISVQFRFNPPTQAMEMHPRFCPPIQSMGMGPRFNPLAQPIEIQSRCGPPMQQKSMLPQFGPPIQQMDIESQSDPPFQSNAHPRFSTHNQPMGMGSQFNSPTQSMEMHPRFGPPLQPMVVGPKFDPHNNSTDMLPRLYSPVRPRGMQPRFDPPFRPMGIGSQLNTLHMNSGGMKSRFDPPIHSESEQSRWNQHFQLTSSQSDEPGTQPQVILNGKQKSRMYKVASAEILTLMVDHKKVLKKNKSNAETFETSMKSQISQRLRELTNEDPSNKDLLSIYRQAYPSSTDEEVLMTVTKQLSLPEIPIPPRDVNILLNVMKINPVFDNITEASDNPTVDLTKYISSDLRVDPDAENRTEDDVKAENFRIMCAGSIMTHLLFSGQNGRRTVHPTEMCLRPYLKELIVAELKKFPQQEFTDTEDIDGIFMLYHKSTSPNRSRELINMAIKEYNESADVKYEGNLTQKGQKRTATRLWPDLFVHPGEKLPRQNAGFLKHSKSLYMPVRMGYASMIIASEVYVGNKAEYHKHEAKLSTNEVQQRIRSSIDRRLQELVPPDTSDLWTLSFVSRYRDKHPRETDADLLREVLAELLGEIASGVDNTPKGQVSMLSVATSITLASEAAYRRQLTFKEHRLLNERHKETLAWLQCVIQGRIERMLRRSGARLRSVEQIRAAYRREFPWSADGAFVRAVVARREEYG